MGKRPPNILFLMTDQQRFDSLGCYGASFAHTPNLDRLASGGAVFEHCYVNNPICTPSRASLFTGKHLPGHGVLRLYDDLPGGEVLFTKRLQELGYTTALFGKQHVSSVNTEAQTRHPNDGWDIYEPCPEGCTFMDAPYQAYAKWLLKRAPEFHAQLAERGRKLLHPPREYHMTYWAAERTINYLRDRANRERPFFCMMSVFEPHNPYEHYPREMGALVDPGAIPGPLPRSLPSKDEPADIGRERHQSYFGDLDTFSQEDLRKIRHGYHASVAYADLEFGRVLDTLEAEGLAENTLVIFTSDHGDMLGDHGLMVKGAFFYDPNVRVPLLMRWPEGMPGGLRIPGLVQLHDLAATLLTVAGDAPGHVRDNMPDARNVLDLALGRESQLHQEVVCCYRNSGINDGKAYWDPPIHATMLRDERYKLNLWHAPAAADTGELYDMVQDPLEQRNLWSQPAARDVRERMTARLHQWLEDQESRFGVA